MARHMRQTAWCPSLLVAASRRSGIRDGVLQTGSVRVPARAALPRHLSSSELIRPIRVSHSGNPTAITSGLRWDLHGNRHFLEEEKRLFAAATRSRTRAAVAASTTTPRLVMRRE